MFKTIYYFIKLISFKLSVFIVDFIANSWSEAKEIVSQEPEEIKEEQWIDPEQHLPEHNDIVDLLYSDDGFTSKTSAIFVGSKKIRINITDMSNNLYQTERLYDKEEDCFWIATGFYANLTHEDSFTPGINHLINSVIGWKNYEK